MKYLVIGAGNQGLAFAGHLALLGETVNVWNRTWDNINEIAKNKQIVIRGVLNGNAFLNKISSVISEVLCDFIIVTVPTNAHDDIAKLLAPYLTKNHRIILTPGRTFGALNFKQKLEKNGCKDLPAIFETSTTIHTCRKNDETSVNVFAIKHEVGISAYNPNDLNVLDQLPYDILRIFKREHSFFVTSLSNIGMILHCAPTLLNTGCIESKRVFFKYYFDGISPTVAKFIEAMDSERLAVGKKLNISLNSIQDWMRNTYHVNGDTLFNMIQSNSVYHEIDAPKTIQHRYIEEDVPNGLVPIESLAHRIGLTMKYVSLIIDLACLTMDVDYRKIGRNITQEEIDKYLNKGI